LAKAPQGDRWNHSCACSWLVGWWAGHKSRK